MNQGLRVINSKNLPENSRIQVFVVLPKLLVNIGEQDSFFWCRNLNESQVDCEEDKMTLIQTHITQICFT